MEIKRFETGKRMSKAVINNGVAYLCGQVAWDNWVEEGFAPARACVEANMADKNILVEVSIVVAI